MNRSEFLKLLAFFPIAAKSVFKGIADDITNEEISLSEIDTLLIKSKKKLITVKGGIRLQIEYDPIDVGGYESGWSEYISAPPTINIECIAKQIDGDLTAIYENNELIEYEYIFLVNGDKMSVKGKGLISGLYKNDKNKFEIHSSGEVVLNTP